MILVQHILEAARKRLAVLSREASLSDIAQILVNPNTPLVVVCDSDGIAVGVMSRTSQSSNCSPPQEPSVATRTREH